ncbi:RNA polymerase sigma factor [Mitsuaria sp. GD03876]|uniref:RNA polymerase sigma factor n=1 Tax=Mitsuaria sp. GD03876 TaxID=2975399 RepID=UPI002449C9C8|nr:RNA polymerase sigma factor [Mitsuaria sp. GD03876]MDH0865038.1 RNA polymerase sigma factor [Mitsuaria sp. GD03876]
MLADPHFVFISHRRELLAWLTHRVRDAHTAQDLVQELFVRFLEAAARQPVQDARAYLFQMARNLLADQARQHDARKTTAVDPQDLVEVQDGAPGPDRALAGRQRLVQLTQALRELPELTQRIFVMVRVEDLSYQEAADRLDLSTSSVQKHLARALAHVMLRVPEH